MLKKIKCDKFREGEVIFHSGLNAVIGDDIASNSIGKSILLMVIDFVFGGSEYIKKNADAIEELGPHEFAFEFNFADEKLYFTRNTSTYCIVNVCDEDFKPKYQLELEAYTKLLQKKYECELDDLSFRSIVGRYFRVYGKENLNEHKPIQYFEKEPSNQSILMLVKLFDKFSTLKVYEEQIAKLRDDKKVLTSAAKKELIPNVSKATFIRNVTKIEELTHQLEQVKSDIICTSTDVAALVSKEILQLRKEKSELVIKRNMLSARLKRIQNNLQNKGANLELEIAQFMLYFPDFNIERAKSVDAFHDKLAQVLKEELRKADKELRAQIVEMDAKIDEFGTKITEMLNIQDAPQIAIDKVIELVAQIKQLTNENSYFTKVKTIAENLKKVSQDLADIKGFALDDICSQINTKMYELNKKIYVDERRAPTFSIQENQYFFCTHGDTGTGTAFANLITFDLSLLELTCLPAIAHDLPLLKNIENPAMEKIILLYAASKKQIFIAIDKINSYDKTAADIIEKHGVIHLSKDKTLFTKNWKKSRDQL